jgi:hypothetical protein
MFGRFQLRHLSRFSENYYVNLELINPEYRQNFIKLDIDDFIKVKQDKKIISQIWNLSLKKHLFDKISIIEKLVGDKNHNLSNFFLIFENHLEFLRITMPDSLE